MPEPCRCDADEELVGQAAVDYLGHLQYVTEHPDGWLFTCPDTRFDWVAPYVPRDAPVDVFVLRRRGASPPQGNGAGAGAG